MSSFRHPVGPERPGTYWRRRAVAAGVLVLIALVVVLIVAGFSRGGASSAAPTASDTPSTSARGDGGASSAASGSASAPASAGASGTASGDASAPATASTGKDGAACLPRQIVLTPITDKTTYGPTEDPQIAMSIENTGTNTCHMDLGSAQQVLTISSGTEPYWTSKDCQTGGTDQDVTIKAGQKLTTPSIAWDRTRSSTTTCDAARPSVTAGGASYHLQVSVGKFTSDATAQFILN